MSSAFRIEEYTLSDKKYIVSYTEPKIGFLPGHTGGFYPIHRHGDYQTNLGFRMINYKSSTGKAFANGMKPIDLRKYF